MAAANFAFSVEPGLVVFGRTQPREPDFRMIGRYLSAVSPDGRHILVGGPTTIVTPPNGRQNLAGVQSNFELHDLRLSQPKWSRAMEGAASFAPAGENVLLIDGDVLSWLDIETGAVQHQLSLGRSRADLSLTQIVYSGDLSEGVLTDGAFAYWVKFDASPTLRKVQLELPEPRDHSLSYYDISFGGAELAEYTGEGIRVFDLRTGRLRASIPIKEACFSGCGVVLANDHETVAVTGLGSAMTQGSNRVDIYSISQKSHVMTVSRDQLRVLELLWRSPATSKWTREAILAGLLLNIQSGATVLASDRNVVMAPNRSSLCMQRYTIDEAGFVTETDDTARIECWPGPGSAGLDMQVLAQVLATAEAADGGINRAGTLSQNVSDNKLSAIAKSVRSLAADPSQTSSPDPLLVRLVTGERIASRNDSTSLAKALCEFAALARGAGGSSRLDVATIASERFATLATLLPSWAVEQCLK